MRPRRGEAPRGRKSGSRDGNVDVQMADAHLMHQPFTALAGPVLDVLPGFAGDWPGAIRVLLSRLAVSVWRERDARRVIDGDREDRLLIRGDRTRSPKRNACYARSPVRGLMSADGASGP